VCKYGAEAGPRDAYKVGMRANARSPDVPSRSRSRIVSPDWWKTILRQPGVLGVYRRVKKPAETHPAEAGEKLLPELFPPSEDPESGKCHA
jgi:hypothetical protein